MEKRKPLHIICNAHLDPVWLWHWEDGLTETLSTFRVAAEFCESNKGFVFNHNEAVLYHWVEENDPVLFKRIQKLVKAGSWHIAGGAWLQPDVNIPNGESHIRQYLYGLNYFKDKFGVRPRVAYNFDTFGHGEGFAQVLDGCGMNGYIFCRPSVAQMDLPVGLFEWKDRSGNSITARRSDDHYLTNNEFTKYCDDWMPRWEGEPVSMILWGLGNHGGGPSKEEYKQIRQYIKDHPQIEVIESTPELFFSEAKKALKGKKLPVVKEELQNCFPGCYTSMSRIKRAHRETESLVKSVERICTLAWWFAGEKYPAETIENAWRDVMFSEFHDILPGSSAPQVEADSLRQLSSARESMSRLRLKTILRMFRNEKKADGGDVPIFVANPHAFRYKGVMELELHTDYVWRPRGVELYVGKKKIPHQRIEPGHNMPQDWRQRVAINVDLAPWEVLRIDIKCPLNKAMTQRPKLPKLP
ncbi:MAG: alpha-mannosidase, partial [Planctomycetes bacterium]|nr:alpha-mannosidase [Planctomycetota bacterium]